MTKKIELLVIRDKKFTHGTIGKLYVDGVFLCNTLEPVDRGLTNTMRTTEIAQKKIKGSTAIPSGEYKVILSYSPKFSGKPFYKTYADGMLPRLLNVPGFDGILIHTGTTYRNTAGCILVGMNDGNILRRSQAKYYELYRKLKGSNDIRIKIESKY